MAKRGKKRAKEAEDDHVHHKRYKKPKMKAADRTKARKKRLDEAHIRHINFISMLIMVLGLLNVLAVVIPYFSEALALPSFKVVPTSFVDAGNAIHMLVGFLLIYLGRQIYYRRRGAWTVILFFLFLSLIASLLSIEKPSSMATFVLTVYLIGWLYFYRDQFKTPSIFRLSPKRLGAVLFFIMILIYGVVGSLTLGEHFEPEIDTWDESIYFTIATMTTVGYGDFIPEVDPGTGSPDQGALWFTIILMVLGFTSFILVIGSMVGPIIEDRFMKVIRMVGGIRTERLSNHLIICGLSNEGRIIVETLKQRKETFVVVCGSEERHEELLAEGIPIVHGDPSESEVLEKVAIKKARALIATSEDDALNAFITITARVLNTDLPIIAMASSRENMKKLKSVGANTVISPNVIGAERILGAALGEKDIYCG